MDAELLNQIATWRAKATAGTLELSEMRQAILMLRQGRNNASATATSSKKSSKGPARSADDLLSELM